MLQTGYDAYQTANQQQTQVMRKLTVNQVYRQQTAPLLPYYEKQGKLVSVDGMRDIEGVATLISDVLDNTERTKKTA